MENQNTQNIPTDILKAIESADVYTHLETIGDRYGLMIDQVGQLNSETEKLMTGKTKSAQFVPTIAKNLEVSNEIAQKIATDINNEIFASLRESLRKMQEESETQTPTKPVSPPLPPTPQPIVQSPVQPTPIPKPPTPTTSPPPVQPQKLLDIAHVEKAGNFSIEKRPPSTSPQYNTTSLKKETVLKDIENPPTNTPRAGNDPYREPI